MKYWRIALKTANPPKFPAILYSTALDPLQKHLEVETSMYEGIVDSCMYTVHENAEEGPACVLLYASAWCNGKHTTMSCMLAVL